MPGWLAVKLQFVRVKVDRGLDGGGVWSTSTLTITTSYRIPKGEISHR